MTRMTDDELRSIGRKAAAAVRAAVSPLLKTMKVDGVLEISLEAEAKIQRRAQDCVDFYWPGRFEITCSLKNHKLELTMNPRKVVH